MTETAGTRAADDVASAATRIPIVEARPPILTDGSRDAAIEGRGAAATEQPPEQHSDSGRAQGQPRPLRKRLAQHGSRFRLRAGAL